MFYQATKGAAKEQGLPHDPFKSLVVPRPIGWISTLSANGVSNLAAFSFFNAMSATPPIVAVCTNGSHSEDGIKDTMQNIQETKEFVVNMATWALRDAVNRSSMTVPRRVDEFELAGVTKVHSTLVSPPGVLESPVNLECRLMKVVQLEAYAGTHNHAAFGRVVGIHIKDDFIRHGLVDIETIQPIARLGYFDYTVVKDTFELRGPEF